MNRGAPAALGAALLFGASTPLAKLLLGETSPWLLAGLLYLGSGFGLALISIGMKESAYASRLGKRVGSPAPS